MEWDKKTKLVQLSNNGKEQEFLRFAIDHVNEFDLQAWDMFITAARLYPKEIDDNIDLWKKLLPHITQTLNSNPLLGLKAKIRMNVVVQMIELRLEIIRKTS